MRRLLVGLCVILLGALALRPTAWAQIGRFPGGTGSLFGQRTMGTSMGSNARSNLFGRGVGNMPNLAQGNLLTGTERFLRGNQQGRFVGRDVTAVRELVDTLRGGRVSDGTTDGWQGYRDEFGRGRRDLRRDGQNRRASFDANGGRRRRWEAVRTRRQVAFPYPQPVADQVSAGLQRRLRQILPPVPLAAPVAVAVDGRTAVLQGVVASEHARVLAEQMAQMEPGVSRVENRLRVIPGPEAAESGSEP
jgi:hypothetical protein